MKRINPRLLLGGWLVLGVVVSGWMVAQLRQAGGGSLREQLLPGMAALAGLGFVSLLGLVWRRRDWAERTWSWAGSAEWLWRLVNVSALTTVVVGLTPSYRYGAYAGYYELMWPLVAGAAVMSVTAWAGMLVVRRGMTQERLWAMWKEYKVGLWLSLGWLGLGGLLWLGIAWSRLGLQPDRFNWSGAGAPVLMQQVWGSVGLALAMWLGEKRLEQWLARISGRRVPVDALMFVLIWLAAGLLWAFLPAPIGWWAPRALPPNSEMYPLSDAMRYDVGSQYALIGQGLNNGRFYYRVFYEGVLFLLHGLVGQDYGQLMTVQALMLAVFPGLVYLLARALGGRTFGVLAGSLVAWAGRNSIVAGELAYVANPKQMLTDYPTAVGLAGFLLLLVLWQTRPGRGQRLLWAGGILGVATLVRTSALGLLPLLVGLVWLERGNWKGKALVSVLGVVMFVASALPWNSWHGRPLLDMYVLKLQTVADERLDLESEEALPRTTDQNMGSGGEGRVGLVEAVANHLAHNLVTTFLILPASPQFHALEEVVGGLYPYWNPKWDGRLSDTAGLMIGINLLLVGLGLGAAYRSAGWRGWVPMAVYLVYIVVNSVGRSSGGRYSAPMDWLMLLYYAWGLLVVLEWIVGLFGYQAGEGGLARQEEHQVGAPIKATLWQAVPVFLVFFGVSAGMLLLSEVVPQRYEVQTQQQLSERFISQGYAEQAGYEPEALRLFLQEEQAGVWAGRALYPRFFPRRDGLGERISIYHAREYPRLIFTLIGPDENEYYVILPGGLPANFPNAVDAIVLGCRADANTRPNTGAVDALAVVIMTDRPRVYAAPPSVGLHCPLELESNAQP